MEQEPVVRRRAFSLVGLWTVGVMLTPLYLWTDVLFERVLKVPSPLPHRNMDVVWTVLVLSGIGVSTYAVTRSRYGRVAKAALHVLSLITVFVAWALAFAVVFGPRG